LLSLLSVFLSACFGIGKANADVLYVQPNAGDTLSSATQIVSDQTVTFSGAKTITDVSYYCSLSPFSGCVERGYCLWTGEALIIRSRSYACEEHSNMYDDDDDDDDEDEWDDDDWDDLAYSGVVF